MRSVLGRLGIVVWLVTASSLTGARAGVPNGVPSGEPVAAVWREQRLDFYYMGRTSRYSCEGLQDKVRALLLDLGVRRDLKVTSFGCDDSGQVFKAMNHGLSIVFSAPALPDAAAKPSHGGDLAALDARFEAFTITRDAFRNMGVGDCELVQEFSRQLLPRLVTRRVQQDITCIPNELTGSRFMVRGEILRSLPRGEHAVGPASRGAPP